MIFSYGPGSEFEPHFVYKYGFFTPIQSGPSELSTPPTSRIREVIGAGVTKKAKERKLCYGVYLAVPNHPVTYTCCPNSLSSLALLPTLSAHLPELTQG